MQLLFLVPLLLSILLAIAVSIAVNYSHLRSEAESEAGRLQKSVTGLYEESIRRDSHVLQMLMGMLEQDGTLRDALSRKDRRALLAHAMPLFDGMKRDYGITHFYFTGPDRVNLLRVHQPQRYGDVIDRVTTLDAERSGTAASGVELGPFGQFTLRVVSPWYEPRTHRLIGYVELGMEIDKVLESVRKLFGTDVYVLVRKGFLQRKNWEEGMRMMGQRPEWDRFPDDVLSVQAQHDLPPALASRIAKLGSGAASFFAEMDCSGHSCLAIRLPLADAAGRGVAEMVLLKDISYQTASLRQSIAVGSAVSVVVGAGLFALFYLLVGSIGRRIERNERVLQELASRDGLTGLYNHRMFYSMLESEVARTLRYKHPLSLLILDVDHFKRVNDTFGHVAGDRVLAGMAKLLHRAVREEDRVCRYGGEEMCVIMPETDAQTAVQAAERLRAAVENASFKDDGGREIRVTISIGVASLPGQAETLRDLVTAADMALYAAKQGGRNCVYQIGKQVAMSRMARAGKDCGGEPCPHHG